MNEYTYRKSLKLIDEEIVGEFRNEFEELFIFSKTKESPIIYFASSENDWEQLTLNEIDLYGYKVFTFTDEERFKVKDLLTKL